MTKRIISIAAIKEELFVKTLQEGVKKEVNNSFKGPKVQNSEVLNEIKHIVTSITVLWLFQHDYAEMKFICRIFHMVEFFLENQTQVCTKKRDQKGLHNWLCNVPEYPIRNQLEITHDSRGNTRFHELELEHTQALLEEGS